MTEPIPQPKDQLAEPPRLPPTAIGTDTPPGGGGGRWHPPRITLLAVVALLMCVGVVIMGTLLISRFVPGRPAPILLSALLAAIAGVRYRGRFLDDSDTFWGAIFGLGVLGGVIGEAATYVVAGIPPSVPPAFYWPVIGALGIGGAIGVGVAIVASGVLACLLALALLVRDIRDRRHAA